MQKESYNHLSKTPEIRTPPARSVFVRSMSASLSSISLLSLRFSRISSKLTLCMFLTSWCVRFLISLEYAQIQGNSKEVPQEEKWNYFEKLWKPRCRPHLKILLIFAMDDGRRKGLLERLTSRAGMLEVGIPLTFLCTSLFLENWQEVFAGNFFYFGDYCGASCVGLLFQREFKEGYKGKLAIWNRKPAKVAEICNTISRRLQKTLKFKICFPGNNFPHPCSPNGWRASCLWRVKCIDICFTSVRISL